jgi:prepilin-type N-terminal cleavage/methylation domain-containing protein
MKLPSIFHPARKVANSIISAKHCTNGFTLIEIIVVIGIFAILGTFGLFATLDSYRSSTLSGERASLVSILSRARANSLSNIDGLPHGVHITPTNYTIFEGSSYDTRAVNMDQTISASNSINHGTSTEDIIFSPLSATTTQATITLSNGVRSETIEVNSEGMINW